MILILFVANIHKKEGEKEEENSEKHDLVFTIVCWYLITQKLSNTYHRVPRFRSNSS